MHAHVCVYTWFTCNVHVVFDCCHHLFPQGCQLMWESYKLEPFVQKFSDMIFNFQERVCWNGS